KRFCCAGCLTVFELLTENDLTDFYQLADTAGVRVNRPVSLREFVFLDDPGVRQPIVDFSDERLTRVTFHIPSIHCIACVWLLENLFRLKPGIGASRVNFPRKEVSIDFRTAEAKLSEVVALLASIGYEPELRLAHLEHRPKGGPAKRLWLQL